MDQKVEALEADGRCLGAVVLEHIERDSAIGAHRDNLAVNKRSGGLREIET
jgi:hypothetical protein